ncbi:MAG: pyridoxal-phosphate dependent enzyme, partial [Oscillospiraceae bacterium]|nr:pyridoxal-phosphate dependent enzyme [Oscillospiraceae bacterium]
GGYARALKDANPAARCYAVEPYGQAYYGDEIIEGASHGIQGGGYAKAVINADKAIMDGAVTVTHEEAVEMTHLLSKTEGIFAGFSSGANFMAIAKLLRGAEKGKTAAFVVNDCGLKYMSTSLWD